MRFSRKGENCNASLKAPLNNPNGMCGGYSNIIFLREVKTTMSNCNKESKVRKNSCFSLFSITLFLCCPLLFVIGCSKKALEASANVLLITIDTLRADHLGCYNYFRKTSPNIDHFASTGVLFEHAYCQMPTTGPSHASIFSSNYPRRLGLLKNGWVLSSQYPTLAENLKKNGYVTSAFVSSFTLDPQFGFARGFDEYDAKFSSQGSSGGSDFDWEGQHVEGGFDQRGDVTTLKAINWIQKHRKEKFFLWVHYFDPHSPYTPPKPYADDFLKETRTPLDQEIANYDGEILFVDVQVGKLLNYFKDESLDSKTLIIIASDHGEGLGQHNWMRHGRNVYDELTRILLLMRFPDVIPVNLRLNHIVQGIDIAPTILDLLKIKKEKSFQGQSLLPIVFDPKKASNQIAFLERRLYEDLVGQKFGIRKGGLKYIWAPEEGTEELYDLTKDSRELLNKAQWEPELTKKLNHAIQVWRQEQETGYQRERQTIDDKIKKKLKSLGYID